MRYRDIWVLLFVNVYVFVVLCMHPCVPTVCGERKSFKYILVVLYLLEESTHLKELHFYALFYK